MSGEGIDEVVSQFCSLTGAEPHVGEQYLEAQGFNLERAANFFFENPPDAAGNLPPSTHGQQEVVDLEAEEDEDARAAAALYEEDLRAQFGEEDQEAGPRMAAGGAADQLEEGGMGAGPHVQGTGLRPHSGPPTRPTHVQSPSDEEPGGPSEDEDQGMLDTMAEQRRQPGAAASRAQHAREDILGRGHMPSMFPNMQPPVPFPGGGSFGSAGAGGSFGSQGAGGRGFGQGGGSDMEDEEELAYARARERVPLHPPGAEDGDVAGLGGAFDRHELEEARMLEASMLGIPYEPQLPVRGAPSSAAAAGASAAPALTEHRSLRYDQDQAYEESLAADRAKEQSARRAAQAAEAEAERAQQEAEASERARAEEEAHIRAELSRKAASLPAEPDASQPGTLNIMVRWPDGTRQARRFCKSDPLQAVFDFIDLEHRAATVKPGEYNLVNSYLRKAFVDGTPGSLSDVGITADTALFLEPKA